MLRRLVLRVLHEGLIFRHCFEGAHLMVLAKDLTHWFISGLSKAAGAEVVLPLGVVCLPTPMTDDFTVPR